MVLCLLATAVCVGSFAGPAGAVGLASIVCGGVKHGSGWKTNSTGGYVGQGCGAGIDDVATHPPGPEPALLKVCQAAFVAAAGDGRPRATGDNQCLTRA